MSAEESTLIQPRHAEALVDIAHLVCCCTQDNISTCGIDVTGEEWVVDGDECVVCRDLWPWGTDCPRCGCEDC